MKRKENAKLLSLRDGFTIHAPESGALALKYGLVGDVSGWAHATVWLSPLGGVYLRPQNGRSESQYVGSVSRGRFSSQGPLAPSVVTVKSRQRAARLELARVGLASFLNGEESPWDLTVLGWVRCAKCARWLSAGASIADGMGSKCSGKGPRTDRALKKQAGLAAMAALIAKGKGN